MTTHADPAPSPAPADRKPKDPGSGVPSFPPVLFVRPPPVIDLGEQVVGSDHWYEIAPIQAAAGMPVTATLRSWCEPTATAAGTLAIASAMGVDERAVASIGMTELVGEPDRVVRSTEPNPPLRVRFHPTKSGKTTAMLHYVLQTPYGAVSEGSVFVVARARTLDASPVPRPSTAPSTKVEDPDGAAVTEIEPISHDFEGAVSRARTAADKVSAHQKTGVGLAQRDSESYKRKPAPGPWWEPLAEIAVAMGIAGVAGIIAKQIASQLERLGSKQAARTSKLILGVADGVKDGLKLGVKKATSGGPSGDEGAGDEGGRFSTNPINDFWTRQEAMLDDTSGRNADRITDIRERLLPLHARDPAIAIATMERVTQGLHASYDTIVHHQARISVAQWVSGVAQSAHGSAQAATQDGHRPTTNMSNVRDLEHAPDVDLSNGILHAHKQAVRERTRRFDLDGVLQLEVEVPRDAPITSSTNVRVQAAVLHGVSQENADRFAARPLRDLPIPLRIDVFGGAHATITRDEAGRVRVTGRLPLGTIPTPAMAGLEVQNLRAATQLVDLVLARPLPLPLIGDAIETDDASGRGA